MSGEKIRNIEELMPTYVDELICVNCKHRAVHTWPSVLYLKELECPLCGLKGTMISTGCPIVQKEAHGG